jgi:hypothetical protein
LEYFLQAAKKKESENKMSDMKKLLESVTKFAGEPAQQPGDQVRGHEKATPRKDGKHPFAGRLVGGGAAEGVAEDEDLEESLMQEYKYYVKEQTPPTANTAPTGSSPVANINPAGTGTAATAQTTAPGQATTPPVAGQPAAKPPVPGQPQQPVAGQPAAQQKPATGAPGAGTATPANPQQIKAATDTVTKIMNNPADPFNAQLQAMLKKAGMVPR